MTAEKDGIITVIDGPTWVEDMPGLLAKYSRNAGEIMPVKKATTINSNQTDPSTKDDRRWVNWSSRKYFSKCMRCEKECNLSIEITDLSCPQFKEKKNG